MSRPQKADLLQGTLDLLILQVASLGPLHGYAIAQRLNQISRDALRVHQGSLYPALHRLEKQAWLRSEWRRTETGRESEVLCADASRPQAAERRAQRMGSPRAGDCAGSADCAVKP
jgi:PadR family transcriptional regulator, regulatory protein PadR